MQLTKEAIDQIKAEVGQAIDQAPKTRGAGGGANVAICANKDLIMSFLPMLVAQMPGMMGKVAGQVVIATAEAWFAKQCPK